MKKLIVLATAAILSAALFADEPAKDAKRPGRPMRPQMGERAMMGAGMMNAGMMMGDPVARAVMDPRVAESLGLTDEQKAKLKEFGGRQMMNRELQEKVRKGTNRQMELLKAEKIDEAAVMAAIDEVFEARKEMAKEQTKRVIAIRSILTPEQVEKARESLKSLYDAPHGRGPRNMRKGDKQAEKPAEIPADKPAEKPAA